MKRLIFLDWLRIFSFASVLIGHKFYQPMVNLSQDDTVHESLRVLLKLALPLVYGGGAGVVVFFLISGYVITHVIQKEQPLEFFIKRFFRIYPLYIFAVMMQYSLMHIPVNPQTLIPQLFLVGDFFNTPHALNGVEWTLRIEVLFYVYMLVLRQLKLIGQYDSALPWVLIITTVSLSYLPQLPSEVLGNHGYDNIYIPFLFLGVFIWLYENKKATFGITSFFFGLTLLQHWHLIDTWQPFWRHDHFAILGVFVFLLVWSFREKMSNSLLIVSISELTYSVYLFHNWLLEYIKELPLWGGLFSHKGYALSLLFGVCFLLVRCIEKPGIKMGAYLIKYINSIEFRLKAFKKVST